MVSCLCVRCLQYLVQYKAYLLFSWSHTGIKCAKQHGSGLKTAGRKVAFGRQSFYQCHYRCHFSKKSWIRLQHSLIVPRTKELWWILVMKDILPRFVGSKEVVDCARGGKRINPSWCTESSSSSFWLNPQQSSCFADPRTDTKPEIMLIVANSSLTRVRSQIQWSFNSNYV